MGLGIVMIVVASEVVALREHRSVVQYIGFGIVCVCCLIFLPQFLTCKWQKDKAAKKKWRNEVLMKFVQAIAQLNAIYASQVEFGRPSLQSRDYSKDNTHRFYYIHVDVKLLVDFVEVMPQCPELGEMPSIIIE